LNKAGKLSLPYSDGMPKEDPVGMCHRGDMVIFGLSRDDTQDKDRWRLRIKVKPANIGLPGKWLTKSFCVYMYSAVNLQNSNH